MRAGYAICALAAVAISSSPVFAQDNSNILVKGQKEKKVCRTYEAPTGSRVGERRICRTPAEWRLAEDTAQRNMDQENRRFQADQAQTLNEQNGLARKLPH